jgi:hypothetical protein
MKPISEWTDEELRRAVDPEDPKDPVAEILRLRREVEDYAGRSRDWARAHRKPLDEIQLAIQWHNNEARRAERAEGALDRIRTLRSEWVCSRTGDNCGDESCMTEYLEADQVRAAMGDQ